MVSHRCCVIAGLASSLRASLLLYLPSFSKGVDEGEGQLWEVTGLGRGTEALVLGLSCPQLSCQGHTHPPHPRGAPPPPCSVLDISDSIFQTQQPGHEPLAAHEASSCFLLAFPHWRLLQSLMSYGM